MFPIALHKMKNVIMVKPACQNLPLEKFRIQVNSDEPQSNQSKYKNVYLIQFSIKSIIFGTVCLVVSASICFWINSPACHCQITIKSQSTYLKLGGVTSKVPYMRALQHLNHSRSFLLKKNKHPENNRFIRNQPHFKLCGIFEKHSRVMRASQSSGSTQHVQADPYLHPPHHDEQLLYTSSLNN